MSNPESFIDEVTEEVRRDRLYATLRKYGWVGVVAVLGVVGGSAYNEWSKAQAAARAQAFGDAMIAALAQPDDAARRGAVAAVPADGGQLALRNLILGSDPAKDRVGTLAALAAVADDAGLPAAYRDLATLRRVLVAGADLPLAERRAALDPIAAPGRPYRVLALEQLAYLQIEEGKPAEAIAALTALAQDQEASQGMRVRAGQVITALGGTPPMPAAAPAPDALATTGG